MKEMSLPNRYALAAFEDAQDSGTVSALKAEALILQAMLDESKDLRDLMLKESIETADKIAVIKEICRKSSFGRVTEGLLVVMANNGRLNILSEVLSGIADLIHKSSGELVVSVNYAGKFEQSDRVQLIANLAKMTGKKVVLEEKYEPSLLCGMSVMIGNTMYDMSARGRIDALKSYLLK